MSWTRGLPVKGLPPKTRHNFLTATVGTPRRWVSQAIKHAVMSPYVPKVIFHPLCPISTVYILVTRQRLSIWACPAALQAVYVRTKEGQIWSVKKSKKRRKIIPKIQHFQVLRTVGPEKYCSKAFRQTRAIFLLRGGHTYLALYLSKTQNLETAHYLLASGSLIPQPIFFLALARRFME